MEHSEFSRVETRIRGYARHIDSASSLPMQHDQVGHDTPNLSSANLQEALVEYLQMINAKLDALLGLIGQEHLENEFETSIEIVELSGSGLSFVCPDKEFNPGDILEFALMIGQFPLHVAAAVGVVSERRIRDTQTVCDVDFTKVRQNDREAIVRFVFKEERERIRQQKWTD